SGEMEANPMTPDKAAIAKACYMAYVNKDRNAAEALIADDFQFTSPLDNRLDRATYFERCWPNSEMMAAIRFMHVAVDADAVLVTYEAERPDGGRFRNTEVLTVRDGQIVEAEVYFG